MKTMHAAVAAAALLAAAGAPANPLVYTPINPTFGGNPLYGSYLLGRAQAQDRNKDPGASTGFGNSSQSQLQQFQNSLQQAILSRIAGAVSSSVIGADGKLIPGTVETDNFRITIADLGSGQLRITTVDKSTGASTSFEISQ